MGNYLISGLPSTGKTTIGQALEAKGYEVFHTDETIGRYVDLTTGLPVTKSRNADREWSKTHGWGWDADKLQSTLHSHGSEPLFICGGSRDEQKFYHLFDNVFVLHVPDEVMRARLTARGANEVNTELFIMRMVEFNQQAYAHADAINGVLIETTKPLDDCVHQILSTIHES